MRRHDSRSEKTLSCVVEGFLNEVDEEDTTESFLEAPSEQGDLYFGQLSEVINRSSGSAATGAAGDADYSELELLETHEDDESYSELELWQNHDFQAMLARKSLPTTPDGSQGSPPPARAPPAKPPGARLADLTEADFLPSKNGERSRVSCMLDVLFDVERERGDTQAHVDQVMKSDVRRFSSVRVSQRSQEAPVYREPTAEDLAARRVKRSESVITAPHSVLRLPPGGKLRKGEPTHQLPPAKTPGRRPPARSLRRSATLGTFDQESLGAGVRIPPPRSVQVKRVQRRPPAARASWNGPVSPRSVSPRPGDRERATARFNQSVSPRMPLRRGSAPERPTRQRSSRKPPRRPAVWDEAHKRDSAK